MMEFSQSCVVQSTPKWMKQSITIALGPEARLDNFVIENAIPIHLEDRSLLGMSGGGAVRGHCSPVWPKVSTKDH